MKELAAFLLVVCLALLALVFLVNTIDPPEPVVLIEETEAAVPAPPKGPIIHLLPTTPRYTVWCLPPLNARPRGFIEKTSGDRT